MSFVSQTFATARELAVFLNTTGLSPKAIVGTWKNNSGYIDVLYDDAYVALLEVTIEVTDQVDAAEVEITGLVPDGAYEMVLFASTPATTNGLVTTRLRRIYSDTGAAGADLRWEESAALAIADSASYVYPEGPTMIADGDGKLYLVYELDTSGPGEDVSETVTLHLRPLV